MKHFLLHRVALMHPMSQGRVRGVSMGPTLPYLSLNKSNFIISSTNSSAPSIPSAAILLARKKASEERPSERRWATSPKMSVFLLETQLLQTTVVRISDLLRGASVTASAKMKWWGQNTPLHRLQRLPSATPSQLGTFSLQGSSVTSSHSSMLRRASASGLDSGAWR